MAFAPPELDVLYENTVNLSVRFSRLVHSYSVKDPVASSSSSSSAASSSSSVASSSSAPPDAKETLQFLLRLINDHVKDVKSDRSTQKAVLIQLANESWEVAQKTGIKHLDSQDRAYWLLIGALLHRYFRLIKEYEQRPSGWWGPADPRSCRLFNAIRKVLQLSPTFDSVEEFKRKDLDILEPGIVTIALQLFRSHMVVEERYKNYEHLKMDSNFITYLTTIINEHEQIRGGRERAKQYKVIRFIKSLANLVWLERKEVELFFSHWFKQLQRDHPDLSALNKDIVFKHLVNYRGLAEEHFKYCGTLECIKKEIAVALYANHVPINFNSPVIDYPELSDTIIVCIRSKGAHIITGGLALLLHSSEVADDLKHCINEYVLKASLTLDDKKTFLKFLECFTDRLSLDVAASLNCEFFEGRHTYDMFITQLATAIRDIDSLIKEPIGKSLSPS